MLQKKIIGIVEEIRSLFETSTTYDINLKDNASFYECIDGRYPDKYLLVINGRQNLIDFDDKTNKIWESDPVLYYNFTKKILNKDWFNLLMLKCLSYTN